MAKSKSKLKPKTGWACIPGKKLPVASDTDMDFDISNWTSPHYSDDPSAPSTDLYDPDPRAESNRFDTDSKLDGACGDAMFYSLEVIDGNSYRIEKSGDETTGYLTKVIFNDKQSETKKLSSTHEPVKASEDCPSAITTTKPLNKRERQQLKRKSRLEAENVDSNRSKKIKYNAAPNDTPLTNSEAQNSDVTQPTKLKSNNSPVDSLPTNIESDSPDSEQSILTLQSNWSPPLHTTLLRGLQTLNYSYPTPIQSATLPPAILGRRDIVGAAPTGSGKTLSYGLPILQSSLERREEHGDEPRVVRALILVPTRELAVQVTEELDRVSLGEVSVGTIVGGFAEVKQRRILERKRPEVLVCTPGRLWELMSSNEYSHLNDLSQLRFLVIDEADRMIKQGSFPQLKQIFEVINNANPPPSDNHSDDEECDNVTDDDNQRLRSLKGVRGEAKVIMLDDTVLAAIEREKNGGTSPKPLDIGDDDYLEQEHRLLIEDDDIENDVDGDEMEHVHRQTFIYSATLTLPPSAHNLIKNDAKASKSKKRKKGPPITIDGAIAEMLDIAGARGEIKIVDLSNSVPQGKNLLSKPKLDANGPTHTSTKKASNLSAMTARLPPGLTLRELRCAQRHKDSHLYSFLVATQQGSSGPCLVFCNSIAAVRRVGETLKLLGLPVKMLHAQMAQKSRLNSLESLRTPKTRCIVVASDVAARGLDIPSVANVVHYDVARTVDTFIHRSGRTARGVGENAVGVSVSLVAPAEEKEHHKICEAVRGVGEKCLESMHIDGRLMSEAQTRVSLATKIVACNDFESQASKKNKWLKDTANDAGLELDEDMLESGLLDGDQRDQQRFIEAKRAKIELRKLLEEPIRVQRYGKFLSGPGLRDAIMTEAAVKPFLVKGSGSKVKRKKIRTKHLK